jgi:dipeptidyl aminopeptidase/acylaminoacyl peptidase
VADAYQRDEYVYERADLWFVTLDGRTERLTDDGFSHGQVAWAPDGERVVLRRQKGLSTIIAEQATRGAPIDLFSLRLADRTLVNLTERWDLIPENPVWAPDGHVYFHAETSGNEQVFRVAAGGGDVQPVTSGDRQLGSVAFDAAFARMSYTAATVDRPGEAFVARLDGTDERRVTFVTRGLFDQLAVRPAERLLAPSQDGTQVEGWLLLPAGYEANKGPYPLILAIHGGAHGAYGNSFSFQHQLWAANGFMVLYTNPRGSTGYGESFLWATWGGWGVLDYQDVTGVLDRVLATYPVDRGRLAVTGYSYGGFLTNWVITQTSRFRAAIVGAGISNWISDYGTADIPRTKESEFFGTPWETDSADLMWKLSPVRLAGRVTTPTLFVHGEADLRVPIEQGEQMYTALQKRRVPSRFIRYPDMYHGGWTPWNTVHRYHEELRWWRERLGPAAGSAPLAPR